MKKKNETYICKIEKVICFIECNCVMFWFTNSSCW